MEGIPSSGAPGKGTIPSGGRIFKANDPPGEGAPGAARARARRLLDVPDQVVVGLAERVPEGLDLRRDSLADEALDEEGQPIEEDDREDHHADESDGEREHEVVLDVFGVHDGSRFSQVTSLGRPALRVPDKPASDPEVTMP